jgi:pyrroline-5-carboxylate reductase
MDYQLGIVGAGNMAEAIVRGVLRSQRIEPSQMAAADLSEQRRQLFTGELKIASFADAADFAGRCRTLLLSVKPQQMGAALAKLGPNLSQQTLIISIAAGISSRFIETSLGNGAAWRVVRTMPNTPMLVGEGMVALSAGSHATATDVQTARELFEAAATVVEVPENLIDAVTAVSGSGPAYVFFLVEQMIAAGVGLGLSPQDAHLLATRTALGAAKMLTSSNDSPAELRRKVTSLGGTTQAAITVMQEAGLSKILIDAIRAAERRSKEMGQ